MLPFGINDVEFRIDKWGDFTAFRLKEKIGGLHNPIIHYAGDIEAFDLPPGTVIEDVGELEDIFHVVLRPDDVTKKMLMVK